MSNQKTIYEKWGESDITIIPETTVLQLTYTHRFFDIELMKQGGKTVTTITPDGIIVSKDYRAGSRKVQAVRTARCSVKDFLDLCSQIENCIKNADNWDLWVDDCSEELTIKHKFEHTEIVDRGLMSGNISIGGIMREFLSKHLCSNTTGM